MGTLQCVEMLEGNGVGRVGGGSQHLRTGRGSIRPHRQPPAPQRRRRRRRLKLKQQRLWGHSGGRRGHPNPEDPPSPGEGGDRQTGQRWEGASISAPQSVLCGSPRVAALPNVSPTQRIPQCVTDPKGSPNVSMTPKGPQCVTDPKGSPNASQTQRVPQCVGPQCVTNPKGPPMCQ